MEDNVLRLKPVVPRGNRAPVDLAMTAPFALGRLQIVPPHREIVAPDGARQTLEPRVMQVFVALARAGGGIVTRDDLIASCWGGTVVGEDSITRTISMLRRIAAESGAGDFRIETITKVGYRLLPGEGAQDAATGETQPAARRSRGHMALAAAALAVLAVLGWSTWQGFSPAPAPEMVLERFAGRTPADRAIAAELEEEIAAGLSRDSLVTPRIGGDTGGDNAFVMSGRVSRSDDLVRVSLSLAAPGDGAPLFTRVIDRPAAAPDIARNVASGLVGAARCVATARENSASEPVLLASATLRPWARYCAAQWIDRASPPELVGMLEKVVDQQPDFANAWGELARVRFRVAMEGDGAQSAMFAASGEAADKALELDERTAAAWVVKSWLVLGVGGPEGAATRRPRFGNFAQWEEFSGKSLGARPSDCGCELVQRGFALEQTGRWTDALDMYRRTTRADPGATGPQMAAVRVLGYLGRFGEARQILDGLGARKLGPEAYVAARFDLALWQKDWTTARSLAPRLPVSPVSSARLALVESLAGNDATGVAAARSDLAALAASSATMTPEVARLLAHAGGTGEAAAAADRLLDGPRRNIEGLYLLYDPGFAEVRASPDFVRLGRSLGLLDYWREHADFCRARDGPAFCRA